VPEAIHSVQSYTATGLSITTGMAAAIILTVGVFVFARGRQSQTTSRFLAVAIFAAAWLAALALAYAAEDPGSSLWWGRVAHLPMVLLPAAALALAAAAAHPDRNIRTTLFISWTVCAVTGLIAALTPKVVTGVVRRPWGHQPVGGPGIIIVSLVCAAVFGVALLLLWNTFRLRDGETSDRAGLLLLAFVLGAPGLLDVLPTFGIEVYPVGYVSTFAFITVAATAVGQFGSVDLTPQFAASQILETIKSAVLLADMHGTIRVANRAAAQLLGYTQEGLVGLPMRTIFGDDEYSSTRRMLNSSGMLEQVMGWKSAGGSAVDVLTSSSFIRDSDGVPLGVVYVASDYSERKRAESRLRESEARYRLLFERNLAGVYRTTVDGRVLDCNDAFARIFGYESRDEILRHSAHSLYFESEDRERIVRQLREHRALTNHEARMRRKDGAAVWVLENMTLLDPATGSDTAVIEGTIIDVTDRKQALDRVEYQAWHDPLTALPNRLLFRDRLNLALAHARRSSRMLAVMYLDLDGFKAVNDSLGHTIGDRLLQATATRLVDSVRAEDTVARMGGDEFTILLPDLNDAAGAATVAQKIIESVSNPVTIDENTLHVTPSIGVAIFPGDGFDADALLKSADHAMYRAKQLGRNNYQYATPPAFDDRASLQRRLAEALEREEFVLHYQPIVDIATGQTRGAEALLRWNDGAAGLRRPESFIAAAEDSDLMTPLGEWILRAACAQATRFRQLVPDFRVCVNLFARQFQQRGLTATIARVLQETELPGSAVQVEVTEAAAMSNPDQAFAAMRELRALGVFIAIDDFGTGYSSFRYLRRLPIDTVKLDEEFVRGISGDDSDRAAVAALISMARSLGVRVAAEGVETAQELELLRREGCVEMQGYLHAPPMPAAELERSLSMPPPPATTAVRRADA
jgi:diguanylate cyclase (GGDEF)-like protein/PAS domain S-box-containing protein